MPDRNARRRGDEELPPDPWAGLAESSAPPPPTPPPPRRTLWHHPAVWVALLVLAAIILVGALLEPRRSVPTEPSPDAVTALVHADPAAG